MSRTILVNTKEWSDFLKEVSKKSGRELDSVLEEASRQTANVARIKIASGPATGRIYKRGTRFHRASAPGEFPKTDTGVLVSSIFNRRVNTLNYETGSAGFAPQGFFLELKSPLRGGRPWLGPSVDIVLEKFKKILDEKFNG
jgi:hypothetical protein